MKTFFSLLSVALVIAACGDDLPPPQTVGVNDVRKACDIRVQWTKRTTTECVECAAIASTPPCDCPALQREYSGKCSTHRDAMLAEATCDGVDGCAKSCMPNDCACVENCYAGKPACRDRGNAMDGCVAEVCDKSCR